MQKDNDSRVIRTSAYLIHLAPFWRVCVVKVFGGKGLWTNPQYCIWVRQASHDPFHVIILGS